MSSRLPIGLAALVATVASGLAWSPDSGAAGGGARAAADGSVELVECNRGRRAADRSALFRGEMRRIAGAAGMRMRFALAERVGRGPWRAVQAPGLDSWRVARPGVALFAYRQRVAALAPGTGYRATVVFQWLDAAGAPIARQTARSATCRQGGALPELTVRRVAVDAGPTDDTARYRVVVVNRGRAPAAGVGVELSVDGAAVDTLTVGRLPARARRRVTFFGPRCLEELSVDVDPDGRIREHQKRDNLRVFGCDGRVRP